MHASIYFHPKYTTWGSWPLLIFSAAVKYEQFKSTTTEFMLFGTSLGTQIDYNSWNGVPCSACACIYAKLVVIASESLQI